MWPLFDSPAFAPFVVAGFVLFILLIVEILGFVFGGLSGLLDNLIPDSLLEADLDTDLDLDFDSDLSLGLKALDWLYVGRIPTMILLILFIGSFCISGILIQQLSLSILGNYISPWLASLDALVISIPLLKVLAALLYPIIPKDETTAISGNALVGQSAKIVIGYASPGQPAQAKTQDAHGQIHYIMVEPDAELMGLSHKSQAHSPFDSELNQPSIDIDTTSVTNSKADSLPSTKPPASLTLTSNDKLIITKKVGERYWVKKV